ncbi:helix-turn-helix domain-containing protein [Microbacterium indicum]|uniref:helix-turn-helix domain-containing protein n=1 Tax=Microbacterium indicum TaxID=358100 RepID=UPI000414D173|nr:helix-turn-helix transcriptional regulator [Microbacterium indicum]
MSEDAGRVFAALAAWRPEEAAARAKRAWAGLGPDLQRAVIGALPRAVRDADPFWAEAARIRPRDVPRADPETLLRLGELTERCERAVAEGDPAEAVDAVRDAVRTLDEMGDAHRASIAGALPEMLLSWARAAIFAFEPRMAADLFDRAYSAGVTTAPHAAGAAAGALAILFALAGRARARDLWEARADGLAGPGRHAPSLGVLRALRAADDFDGEGVRAALASAGGVPTFDRDLVFDAHSLLTDEAADPAAAAAFLARRLERGEATALASRVFVALVVARLETLAGAPGRALAALERWVPAEHDAFARAPRAEALLYRGDLDAADFEATHSLSRWHDAPRDVVSFLVVRALVSELRGDAAAADAHAREAVSLAERFGVTGSLALLSGETGRGILARVVRGDEGPVVAALAAGAFPRASPTAQLLSARETALVRRIAAGAGLTNPELAAELGVSVNTVKTQLRSAMHRLGARDRVHLIRLARAHGYLD